MKNNLQFLHETPRYKYYRSFFDDIEVFWLQDKNTGGFSVCAESAAEIFGFGSFEEMISDDWVLDQINEYSKKHKGKFPIFTIEDEP